MSVLAWLFGLGGLAVAAPFLLHLVRQQPKNRTEFSSLMFLKPTPPRLTEKRQLQNLLLLLLRMAAIVFIALAFMRPLFRSAGTELTQQTSGREIVILLDSSASMQRVGLKAAAIQKVREFSRQLEEGDQIALCAFDGTPQWLIPFSDAATNVSIAQQVQSCVEAIDSHQFGSQEFALDEGLGYASETLVSRNEDRSKAVKQQVVLVTDQQQTSTINGLSTMRWDDSIKVAVLGVDSDRSNATVLSVTQDPEREGYVNVRLINHGTAGATEFGYRFHSSGDELPTGDEGLTGFYAANEQTSTVPLAVTDGEANALTIANDGENFDNTFYFTKPTPQHVHIVFLDEAPLNDPDGMAYYVAPCFTGNPQRQVTVSNRFENTDPSSTLVVAARPLNDDELAAWQKHLELGGKAVVVLTPDNAAVLASLAGASMDPNSQSPGRSSGPVSSERRNQDYLLMVDFDYSHPVLGAFAQAGLNDFSDIKFWNCAQLSVPGASLASFDDGRPAIWQVRSTEASPKGQVLGIAASWSPGDSQWAVSVKFPIFWNELINWSCPRSGVSDSLLVGQPLPRS